MTGQGRLRFDLATQQYHDLGGSHLYLPQILRLSLHFDRKAGLEMTILTNRLREILVWILLRLHSDRSMSRWNLYRDPDLRQNQSKTTRCWRSSQRR